MADSQPADDGASGESETVDAVTWFEATNADTQALILGRYDEGMEHGEPEEDEDGHPVQVRRYYEPVKTIDLPEPMPPQAAFDWVNGHRDHDGFEGYDWDKHDKSPLMNLVVKNRSGFNRALQNFERQLAEVSPASIEVQEQVGQIQEEMANLMVDLPPAVVDEVEQPEGENWRWSDYATATESRS